MADIGLNLWIPGLPIAQPRARAGVAAGRVVMYGADSKHKIHDWKAVIRMAAANAMAERKRLPIPAGVPVELIVRFIFPRSKTLQKADKEGRIRRHVQAPDADNLVKAVKDALNLIVWADDCQVCDEHVFKRWAILAGDECGCSITVREVSLTEG